MERVTTHFNKALLLKTISAGLASIYVFSRAWSWQSKMDYEEKFKNLLVSRGVILNPRGNDNEGFRLCQGYQHFLYAVADGTQNRDSDGGKFWHTTDFLPLDVVKSKFGQEKLTLSVNAECYIVFADFNDGNKFLCFRKLRPSREFPIIHINHGVELKTYAKNFEDLVENYEFKRGY